jgi:hypothetical protein
MGIDIPNRTAEIWDSGAVKFSGTSLATAGVAVSRVLLAPEKTANRFLYIRDFTISQEDVVSTLERLSGDKWMRQTINGAERIARGKARLEKGDPNGVYDLIKSAFFVEGLKTNFEKHEILANEMLGLPVLSLDEVVGTALKK